MTNIELLTLIIALYGAAVSSALLIIQSRRNKARLIVEPVHPEIYQWWFQLPSREYEGIPTRGYGFLLYIAISNGGLQKVSLKSWRLFIKTRVQRQKQELKAISIPEPVAKMADLGTKVYPVLGQKGPNSAGETEIDGGCTLSGWVYYTAEYYGYDKEPPVIIENGKIKGTFVVRDIFGGKAKIQIIFSERDFESINNIIPGIATLR